MTRREAIKVIGGGAALMGMGALSTRAADAAPAATGGSVTQPFALPKLGYGYDALEPHFDARTMEIHYTKHHAAYVKNANKALEGHPELASMTGEGILTGLFTIEEPLRTTLRNNVGGHVNHSLWWSLIAPSGGAAPSGDLAAAITAQFGSIEIFKTKFTEAAMKRFGSGWAWLSVKGGKLAVSSTANQDSPISDGAVPVIGIDVWEHAYYLEYQNRRADYVAAFWDVVNWDHAGKNYAAGIAPQAAT
jgi:superoxide dismutase, Fe-Mn family